MEKEIEDYLTGTTNLLNGQLRGAINAQAREDNRQLIMLTIHDVFERAYGLGKSVKEQQEALKQLKDDLKEEDDSDGSES